MNHVLPRILLCTDTYSEKKLRGILFTYYFLNRRPSVHVYAGVKIKHVFSHILFYTHASLQVCIVGRKTSRILSTYYCLYMRCSVHMYRGAKMSHVFFTYYFL
jgi:hypothetical protein